MMLGLAVQLTWQAAAAFLSKDFTPYMSGGPLPSNAHGCVNSTVQLIMQIRKVLLASALMQTMFGTVFGTAPWTPHACAFRGTVMGNIPLKQACDRPVCILVLPVWLATATAGPPQLSRNSRNTVLYVTPGPHGLQPKVLHVPVPSAVHDPVVWAVKVALTLLVIMTP
jgi:hypothetical protein